MALTKFTEDVNNVQNLPDKPTESADELKAIFDKASNDIKEFINQTLIKELDKIVTDLKDGKIDTSKIINDLTTGGTINVASAEIAKNLKMQIDDLSKSITTSITTEINKLGLKSGAKTKISSGTGNPSGGDNGDVYIQYF